MRVKRCRGSSKDHTGPASGNDDSHFEPSAIVEHGDSYMSPTIKKLNCPAQLPALISACLGAHYGLTRQAWAVLTFYPATATPLPLAID